MGRGGGADHMVPLFNKHPERENPSHPGAVGNNFSSLFLSFFFFKLSLLSGSFLFFLPLVRHDLVHCALPVSRVTERERDG